MKHYRICPNIKFANLYKEALSTLYSNVNIYSDYFNKIYVIYE